MCLVELYGNHAPDMRSARRLSFELHSKPMHVNDRPAGQPQTTDGSASAGDCVDKPSGAGVAWSGSPTSFSSVLSECTAGLPYQESCIANEREPQF